MFDVSEMAPLLPKDIGVGTLLWYKGFTSRGPWDCPAVIYRVTKDRKFYYVMSLDDMAKQDTVRYEAEPASHSRYLHEDMRLASVAEVDAYLKKRKAEVTAQEIIAQVQKPARRKAVR